jgi:hypothetical protein
MKPEDEITKNRTKSEDEIAKNGIKSEDETTKKRTKSDDEIHLIIKGSPHGLPFMIPRRWRYYNE